MLQSALLSLSLALPALSVPLLSTRVTESWSIPTMKVHLMGRDTGIPGNTWPDNRKFNTTLDFTLDLPSSEVQCSANWKYQQISTDVWPCSDTVSFQLSPAPDGFTDAQWTLTITEKGEDATYVASQVIENNSPGTPNSYLSCIGGAPYDGVRCALNGWAGKSGPIALTANSQKM